MKTERKQEDNEIHSPMSVNDRLIFNLRNLSHTMRALYEGKGSQKHILIVLSETGRITQRDLTEHLGIRPGSASEVIAKLENSGHIIRSLSDTDRRTLNIELSEEGKKAAREALEQRKQRHEEMFSCLSEEEKCTLLSLLETVNDDWKDRYHEVHHHGRRHCHGGHHGRKHQQENDRETKKQN